MSTVPSGDRHPLTPLFDPNSIAVFGASERPDSVGAMVFKKLATSRFEGTVVPVNPKYKSVMEHRCLPSIGKAERPIDLAVICTPAQTVPAILRDCAAHGTMHAIVLSAGFGEADSGTGMRDELLAIARETGIRVLGPNCVGLVRPWLDLDATFLRTTAPAGTLAIVSQSGALCSAISDWAAPNHLGLSALVSLGNGLDIGFGEVVEFLADDPKTKAILLYVEGVRDGPAFVSALRYATWRKPVVVLKAGRSADASRAAATHTGALMGDDDIFNAALERTGAVRAMTFAQLFAAAEILASGKKTRGGNLAIVTNGGGAGVLASDRASELHLTLPPPSEDTIAKLDKVLPAHWSRNNPIDVIGDATAPQFGAAVSACLDDGAFDGVLAMLTPQAMTDPVACAEHVIAASRAAPGKPVLACWMGHSSVVAARSKLSEAGIADFNTPESAVDAFSILAQHRRQHDLALEVPGPRNTPERDIVRARAIIDAARAAGRRPLSQIEAKDVLSIFGIATDKAHVAASEDALDDIVAAVGFPCAIKIHSPDISHKSDVDGVRLDIGSHDEARQVFRDMTARAARLRPKARIEGVVVEPMASLRDAREFFVGVTHDPVFGAAIAFGLGGTQIEVLRDRSVSLPPLTEVLARRMISKTRADRLLDAFRNLEAADRDAVVDVLIAISDLAVALPEIAELDINPLLAGPDGVLALDARIVLTEPMDAAPHLAVAPYPTHIDRRERLGDGTEIHIRPIHPEDADQERAFVANLSPNARRLRFFGSTRGLSDEQLARFTQVDFRREFAIVALAGTGDNEQQVGVARFHVNPGGFSANFAIVVSDAWQRKGIARRLKTTLIEEAKRRGIKRLRGMVLRENKAMLGLARSLGYSVREQTDEPGIYVVELDLD